MIDLLELHKQFIAPHIFKGAVCADFTMGNGHDTLWLCRQSGKEGRVYAFDIQEQAIESTRTLLKKELNYENYTLIHSSHANALDYIKEPINIGMFNLGYLPGGDKSITTLRPSTQKAVEAAISLLGDNAVLLVAVYPGHAEGEAEGEMLGNYFSTLSRFKYCCGIFRLMNSPTSPYFYIVETK